MLKCKTCKYFKQCVIDCNTQSGDSCCSKYLPPTHRSTIGTHIAEDVRVVCSSIDTGIKDTSVKDTSINDTNAITSILESYFKDIIPVLKEQVQEQVPVEDKTIIKKITYIIRNLGHIIGKSESEDIFREELFINLIHEDFEINQALDHAISKIENSIKSRGIEVGFDSAKIYKIADIVTEIRMIYKLILACGLSGYANEIMSHVIAAKFTLRQTQVLKEKK